MDQKKAQFSRIYDEYIEKIYRFVYLKVSSKETAEDITSRVFLSGWQAYSSKEINNPRAFLYQIARNTIADHYRGADKEKTVPIDDAPHIAEKGKSIHESAALSADIEIIKTAILGLKKDYQDILLWHYLEDMSVKEIAEIMEKPEGTVRVMLHRGLKSLKSVLEA